MSQGPPSGFPPPVPPGWPASGAGIPWDRREELGFVSALVETTKEVLTGPSDFFRRMPVAGGIGSPLLYAVVIGYLGLLLSVVYSAVFLPIVLCCCCCAAGIGMTAGGLASIIHHAR